MVLYLLAFLGGILTLLSPCILPVLPFVFARSGRPALQGSVPLLAGMAITFAGVASLGAVAGAWATHVNQFGRWAALAALALFATSLLVPRVAGWWTHPLVGAGERLARTDAARPWLASMLLGAATGLVWSPCAGPILGLVLSTAALAGPSVRTSLLLLSYGVGAGVSLLVVLRLGAPAVRTLKERFVPRWADARLAGVAMLAGVIALAAGLDTRLLANISAQAGTGLEIRLLQRGMAAAMAAEPVASPDRATPRPSGLPVESTRADLDGGTHWLNGSPQSIASLRGKVVLVNFWTYSCINCLRTLPYVKAWAERYGDRGLVVIGVHAPEFAFEKEAGNVRGALQDLKISYPVVQDNDFRIWRAFGNQYWPALYLLDAQGRVRYHRFGEGGYATSERAIEDLLAEIGAKAAGAAPAVAPDTRGVGLAADAQTLRTGETYLGYEKAEGLRVDGSAKPDQPVRYRAASLRSNTWTLAGSWTQRAEWVEANEPGDVLAMRFQARDANLVLGTVAGRPVRFRVLLDGHAPGPDHGADVDEEGNGVVRASRLYQLVRQGGAVKPRTVEIHFVDPGVRGYAFTFG